MTPDWQATTAETDFGQDFGHPYLTDFGQTDFGQLSKVLTDLSPIGVSIILLFVSKKETEKTR